MLNSRWNAPARGQRMRHGRGLGKRGVTRNNPAWFYRTDRYGFLPVKDLQWRCAAVLAGRRRREHLPRLRRRSQCSPSVYSVASGVSGVTLPVPPPLRARLQDPSWTVPLLRVEMFDLDYLAPQAAFLLNLCKLRVSRCAKVCGHERRQGSVIMTRRGIGASKLFVRTPVIELDEGLHAASPQ